jgi:uncharacterized RDD family membrane protein YckC
MAATIDFKTAHNIVINYQLASIFERALACVIDLMVLTTVCGVIAIVFGVSIFPLIIMVIFSSFYTLFMEYFLDGQTLGKKLMKIKVVALNGQIPSLPSFMIRWTFRLLDIFLSVGAVAMLAVASSMKAQRIGDLLANTTVVKSKNEMHISLNTLEVLNEKKVNFLYPTIAQFSDYDMLVVKKALERFKKYQTDENYDVIYDLSEKITQVLQVKNDFKDKVRFLESILKEYILITR